MQLRSHLKHTHGNRRTDARRRQRLGTGWTRAALLSGATLALSSAPIALATGLTDGSGRGGPTAHTAGVAAAGGYAIRGGIHNPARSAYYRTTGIFSRNGGWTDRVENLGSGGATLDACHAPAGGLSCLDGYNLSGGLAFMFNTSGLNGGEILLSNPNGSPFTTNAHGVATGLNANYLQGVQAAEFQLASKPAANADKLGGQPPSSYVGAGQLLFADVVTAPTLKIENTRGATAVSQSASAYTVSFGTSNVSKCSYTASPTAAPPATGGQQQQLWVQADAANAAAVIVNAPSEYKGGFDLQVVC